MGIRFHFFLSGVEFYVHKVTLCLAFEELPHCQVLLLSYYFSHFGEYEVVPHCGFDLHFQMTSDVSIFSRAYGQCECP